MILKVERFSAGRVVASYPSYTFLELRGGQQTIPFVTGEEVVVLTRSEFNDLYDGSPSISHSDRLADLRAEGDK